MALVQGDGTPTSAASLVATAVHPIRPLGRAMGLDSMLDRVLSVWQVDARLGATELHVRVPDTVATLSWDTLWTQHQPARRYTPDEQKAIAAGRQAWARLVPKGLQTLALAAVPQATLDTAAALSKSGATGVLAFPGPTRVKHASSQSPALGEQWLHISTLGPATVHLVFVPTALMAATDIPAAGPPTDVFEDPAEAEAAVMATSASLSRLEQAFKTKLGKAERRADKLVRKVDRNVERFESGLEEAVEMTAEVALMTAGRAPRAQREKKKRNLDIKMKRRAEKQGKIGLPAHVEVAHHDALPHAKAHRNKIAYPPTGPKHERSDGSAPDRGRQGRGRGRGRGGRGGRGRWAAL